MRLLLDTHIFLWTQTARARLGDARALIADVENEILISAVVPWEIAIKYTTGRLPLPTPPREYVADVMLKLDARPVAIEGGQAVAVADLPALHRDPFDRLLVAQALILGATLVTADRQIAAYPADTILV